MLSPAFGKTKKEIEKSVGEILNECDMVREQVKHDVIYTFQSIR